MTGVRMLAALLAGLLLTATAGAEVYRWQDEQGRVHFGDRPPSGAGQPVDIKPAPPSAPAAPATVPDRQRLLEMYEREREEKRAAKAKQAQQRAEVERRCHRAADNLRRYLASGPLYRLGKDGKRSYLSAEAKDAEIAKLRGILQRNCGGVPAGLAAGQGR